MLIIGKLHMNNPSHNYNNAKQHSKNVKTHPPPQVLLQLIVMMMVYLTAKIIAPTSATTGSLIPMVMELVMLVITVQRTATPSSSTQIVMG